MQNEEIRFVLERKHTTVSLPNIPHILRKKYLPTLIPCYIKTR